jgi:hypothetical protein
MTMFANSFESISTVESMGKGFATTASFEGIESLSKNPAGIAGSNKTLVQTNYADYFGLYKTAAFGFSKELSDDRVFSIQVPIISVDDIPKTIDNGGEAVQIGSFSDQQVGVSLGVASYLSESIVVGSSFHFISHQIDDESATGMTLDFGAIMSLNSLQIGASVTNIVLKEFTWAEVTNESLPLTVNLGAVYDVYQATFYSDFSVYDNTLQINGAAEWHITEQLDVYAGIFDGTNTEQITFGTTLHLDRFDMSYSSFPNDDLGTVHKLGLMVQI